MKQITKYIGLLAILPLVLVALSPDLTTDADATKPGAKINADYFGSATDHIVCGGQLCTTPEGSEDPTNVSRID